LSLVDDLKADVLIIQECEDPSRSTKAYRKWAGDYLWVGDSKNKGIGVFSRGEVEVSPLNWHGQYKIDGLSSSSEALSWFTSELRMFLPFTISNGPRVLAVWTKSTGSEVFSYIGQFWKYLQIHRRQLSQGKQLIVGDFNSNTIWDKCDRWWNHSDVVSELKDLGIESLYHKQYNEKHGEESKATFFLHRNTKKAYHIDYAFVSSELMAGSLIIGSPDEWLDYSDHMPLLIEF